MRHYWHRAVRFISLLLISYAVVTSCVAYDMHIEDAGIVAMENWSSMSCKLENISDGGLLPRLFDWNQAVSYMPLRGSWWVENNYQLFCAADLLDLGTNPDFIVDIKQSTRFRDNLDYKVVKASKKVHLCKYRHPATAAISLRISEAPCSI